MKENTIVTIKLVSGEELVGKYIIDDMVNWTIYRPRLVQANEKGVGLYDGICLTGKRPDDNIQFPKNSVSFVVETIEEIANGWTTQTTGVALPTKGLVL